MTLLKTRHSLEFNPISSCLKPNLSPYAECYHDYKDKRKELGSLVGTDDFIWCIPASRDFQYFEIIKPVEWVIQVRDMSIMGYVCDQQWFNYLAGKSTNLEGVYSGDSIPADEYSVLVRYPLQIDEIRIMRIFRFIDPGRADLLCEKHF